MATTAKKQHVPIFVSSTYKDLASHREEVQRRLMGLEQIVKGMEFFGSNPESPLDVCLQKVSECKLMILLIGVSYGSVVKDMGKSFTELEYERAVKSQIPVLVYMADLSSTEVGIPLSSVDKTNWDRLEVFKKKLSELHVVSHFSSIDDLGKRIEHDVPEMLKKLENIRVNAVKIDEEVNEEMLAEGAKKFELFWLRPRKYAGEVVPIRLRINKKWGGWKVKDELIKSVGGEVGDTISTETTAYMAQGIIDDDDDTDLFASGEAADWLLENAPNPGSVIDCYVRFSYCKAPVGANNKMVNKVSLVLIKGIRYVDMDRNFALSSQSGRIEDLIRQLAQQA